MLKFGDWLKKIRNQLRLSQEAFAVLVGVKAHETVWVWERSEGVPNFRGDNREAIVALLGCDDIVGVELLWKSQQMPDMGRLSRLAEAKGLYRKKRTRAVLVSDLMFEALETWASDNEEPPADLLERLFWNAFNADTLPNKFKAAAHEKANMRDPRTKPKPPG